MSDWPVCATYPNLECICRGALTSNKATCTRKRTGDLEPIKTYTPGGNQVCEECGRWYGPGQKKTHDCRACMCGEPMNSHGWGDPPHIPVSQEDYYREQGVE